MQDYLKKSVSNQRTGANIVGITLDNLNLMNFSDDFKTTFNIIEEFAKRTDQLNLRNEQEMFKVNLRRKQLDFEQKYAGIDVYNDDDKYKSFIEDYKNLKIQAEEEIQKFKFLSPQDKKIFLEDYKNEYQEGYTKMLIKRNEAVTKKTVDKTQFLIESKIENIKLENISNQKAIVNGIKSIASDYDELVKVGYLDEYGKAVNLVKDISDIEMDIVERQINEEIIYGNKYPTMEEKKNAIKELQKNLNNPERINSMIDNTIKNYKLDDRENVRMYMKAKLENGYNKINVALEKNLYNLEKDKKNLLEDNSKKIQEAYYKRNTSDYINYKYGVKNVSTSQLLNYEETLKLVTDIPAEDFGDSKKGLAFPFITDGINTALNGQIAGRKKNPNYTLDEVYKPIYDFATENCGEKAGYVNRRKALIIDYALKNGIEPDVLLKGENNPDYFKVSNIMSIGSQENKDNLNIGNLIEDKEEFNKLSMAFSPIKSVGDLMATNYILGKAKARGQEDMLLQFPELGLKKLMRNIPAEEYTREIKIAKEITLNRTPYRYVNYNEKIEEKKEILIPKNAKQSEMFGG